MITRNPVLLVGILGTLVATAVSGVILLRGSSTPHASPSGKSIPAVRLVAAVDLHEGARLEASHMQGSTKGGRFTSTEQRVADRLVGQVLTKEIRKGGEIREADVRPYVPPEIWNTLRIPFGLRGMRIVVKGEPTGRQQMMRAGDHVDILGLVGSGTAVVAENVLIMDRFDPRPSVGKNASGEETESGTSFILGVTMDQATRIADADRNGQIRFLARHPEERMVSERPRGIRAPRQGDARPAAYARPRAVPPWTGGSPTSGTSEVPVRIIRGTQNEIVSVPRG